MIKLLSQLVTATPFIQQSVIPTSVVQQPTTATPFIQQQVIPTSVVQQPTTTTATTFVQQLVKPISFIQHLRGTQSTSFITPTVPSAQNTTGIESCSQDIYSDGLTNELTDDDIEFLLSESTDNHSSTPILPSTVSPRILPLPSLKPFSLSSMVPASVRLPVPPSTSFVTQPVLSSSVSVPPSISPVTQPNIPSSIPPPHFSTPPKLRSVQDVMNDRPGTDVQRLRELAIALARDAVFGKDQLVKCSLSGRKHTGTLDQEKLDYIKMAVHSRVPNKSPVEFEHIWQLCRSSISKSCQALRLNARRKL